MNEPIRIGDIELSFVSGGRLWIDGGNMFGVVPRAMWAPVAPPDDQNRIQLETNCVVVRRQKSLGLIDTGYGGKLGAKVRQRHSLDDGTPLARNLAPLGIAPDEFDWVILTHLHFDHAGGATVRNQTGHLQPMFPRARHFVQRAEWDDAVGNLPELAGAYHRDDIGPIEVAGLLQLVDGDAVIAPGVTVQLTGAHTRGHQIVRLESAGESAVLLADMCPTSAHLRTFWTMAYDQFPLDVRRKKPAILNDIADHRRAALFSHDPHTTAYRLTRESDDQWSATPLAAR
jgi:glyoxylase-like metal-dependent hydrolase (beta-lactamase superfamily II)